MVSPSFHHTMQSVAEYASAIAPSCAPPLAVNTSIADFMPLSTPPAVTITLILAAFSAAVLSQVWR